MTEKLLLNVPEFAELLRVQENTIRVWISKGKVIPRRLLVRVGRRTFFNAKQTTDWIENGCKLEILITKNSQDEERGKQM